MNSTGKKWNVLDLFSGAGGMSYGFHAHPAFRVIGAVDAQCGKPSSGKGTLECNKTYELNIGITPLQADISQLAEDDLRSYLLATSGTDKVDVLISCAPCTGFSRTIRQNLVNDDPRNSLVTNSANAVAWFRPEIFLMENVGELLVGKFRHHFAGLREKLEGMGYSVHAEVHSLDGFGLPQRRKRALVIAVKNQNRLRTLHDLWDGFRLNREAVTVRRAIGGLPVIESGAKAAEDPMHAAPALSPINLRRLDWTPRNGGSWPDLLQREGGRELLIPSMLKYADQGLVGPHRDVYGRMAWDEPAVTIKRECSHIGNGRYAHPDQNRLCSVREMAILQGFPRTYEFRADAFSNMYRHIGDAVPPLISHQLAHVCSWTLTGVRPRMEEIVLPGTNLKADDIKQKGDATAPQTQMALTV